MVNVVSRPGDVTLDWINSALEDSNNLDAAPVSSFSHELIGTGKMGDNARFTLNYDGDRGNAPATLVGKFPAADETARSMASAGGAYFNEVMFYRKLAPRTSMRTPAIYAAEISDDKTEFTLLMEDLAPAEPGNIFQGESRDRARIVLTEIAKLAAAFYGDEALGDQEYVMSAREDGGAFGQALMEQNWPGFLERFGHGLSDECIAFGERFTANYQHYVTHREGAPTLTHGDLRNENILFGEGTATTVDWQTPGEGSPLTDACYFLAGSLEIDDRRAWERELLSDYRTLLAAQGVDLAPEECWRQYRRASMHAIVITVLGASFSEPAERSDRMFLTMIQRHLQQCIDLDAGEFLP